MQAFLSKNILYTFLLIFLPSLAIVSWTNVMMNNITLETFRYVVTYILPAIIASYIISVIATENLHEHYSFTFPKIIFTFLMLTGVLVLFSYSFTALGFHSIFITLNLTGLSSYQEFASKFYTTQITIGMIFLVIFYSIANYLFKEKSFSEIFPTKKFKFRKFRIQRKMRVKLRKAFRLAF